MRKKLLFLFALILLLTESLFAQLITVNTYRFNAANTGPTGITPTQLIGPNSDDVASAVTDIGFTYWFAGTAYTQFSVDENGLMKLGSSAIVPEPVNNLASATNLPKIAPYWDDLATGTNGNVTYYLGGTAPSRILYVNWNVTVPKAPAGTANAVFQVQLYEQGSIHFAFGPTYPATNAGGYSMGIGVSATDWASVTVTGNTSATVAYGGTPNNSNTMTPGNGSVKRYQFVTDNVAPTITAATIPNTAGTANRTLTTTIADQAGSVVTGIPTSGSLVPRIYYKKGAGGSWFSTPGILVSGSGTSGSWTFTVDHSLVGGVVTGDQIYYYLIAQDQADYKGSPNITSSPAGVVATNVNTVTTPPATAPYYLVSGSFTGIKTVGSGGDFESLTLPGGLFDQINAGELTGNLTVNIISDLTEETGTKGLNAWISNGGPFTISIHPVGNRIVSGTPTTGIGPLISLNGVTGLTIDGLNDGTNSLTIDKTGQASVGAAIDLKGTSNCIINRSTVKGFGASASTISISNSTTAPPNNNLVTNCLITTSIIIPNTNNTQKGISLANTHANAGDGNIIDHNSIQNFVTNGINVSGKLTNTTISANEIFNTTGTAWNNTFNGISIGITGTGTASIFNNKVHDILIQSPGSGLIPAILSNGGTGTTTNIFNNVVYLDASFTHPTQGWAGIQTSGLGAVNAYYNSIYIGGSGITGTASSYGIKKDGTGATNILNNVVFNARSNSSGTGKHYGLYAGTGAFTSDFNDIFVNGTGGFFGFATADRLTLADWQTATSQDASSLSVDPQYTSATNLLPLNMALNAGTPVAGITTDILGLSRHISTPSIGAYELPKPTCQNPSGGGTISSDQTGCSPFNPVAFTSVSLPSGYFGTLEYKWQSSTTSSSTGFADIPGSNAATFDAGPLTVTTWFKRVARVDCTADWTGAVESNVVMVTVNNCDMTLNLSGVLLEGLYNSGGTMNRARDASGFRWPAGVADHITIELHDAANYNTIVYSVTDVPLSITGTASVIIPVAYNASYFITIKHHNSIETTTATVVSFASPIINQAFGTTGSVFGGNLGLSGDGYSFIFGGDVNQNGLVDSSDMTPIDNLSSSFGYGLAEDVNCDGLIDSRDMTIVDNNSSAFVSSLLP